MNQDWDAEKALKKWLSRNMSTSRRKENPDQHATLFLYEEGSNVPIAELESAVVKAAEIVSELGTNYIDIFNRAESELVLAKEKLNTFRRIRFLASRQLISEEEGYLFKP